MPHPLIIVAAVLGGLLALVVIYDLFQRSHAILRNFPIIGHFRYMLETIGPELRQYIVTSNDEERPFSRDERTWIYTSSKKKNNYFGFGTDNELERQNNYLVFKQAAFPYREPEAGEPGAGPDYDIPCAKVLGAARGRKKAFRPSSIVNVSAMSYGSLSRNAIEAINRGAALCHCLHNTGEGGVAPYHKLGGDLIWQLGTGYYGARTDDGRLDMKKLIDECAATPAIKAIEVKLSQGAKPGLGGVLPGKKVTAEISRIRGIPVGKDCLSPNRHREFDSVDGMLDLVEKIAEETGLPVGIKSAVGEIAFWEELATLMAKGDRGVDYIAVDGGEGGTGAAPLVFSDHVALPFKIGMGRVYRVFAEEGVHESVVFAGAGKLGLPESAMFGFALGCDMIQVAREAMMAIGCIQAQRCHTGHCPAGVATQNRWLMRGLDPTLKSARLANYVKVLRKEILWLSRACGVVHPALFSADHIEILDGRFGATGFSEVFGYEPGWGLPSEKDRAEIERIMTSKTEEPAAAAAS